MTLTLLRHLLFGVEAPALEEAHAIPFAEVTHAPLGVLGVTYLAEAAVGVGAGAVDIARAIVGFVCSHVLLVLMVVIIIIVFSVSWVLLLPDVEGRSFRDEGLPSAFTLGTLVLLTLMVAGHSLAAAFCDLM